MQVDVQTITWPLWQLVVVLLVVFFAAAFFGYYSFSSEASKKIRDAQERAEVAVRQAQGEAERAAARIAQAEQLAAAAPAAPPGKTLLRLWLDDLERAKLDLDGQTVDTSQISEHNRKRLITLVTVMRPWIEGKPAAPAPPPAPVAAPPPVTSAPIAPPPVSKPVTAPPPAPVVTPAKKEERPSAPLSIVGQIDEILQARLANSPLLSRGIRLQESPEGAVIVVVGIQKFSGVGDVTDPEIQAEIKAAIAEWENKYTPGL